MVWAIVVVAIAVLGVAAWAGTGRLGEMPATVSDRPKGLVPDGPVDATFLSTLSLPMASTGYSTSQVDAHLAAHVAGGPAATEARFDVVRRGYDMQAVDAVLERMRSGLVQAVGGNSTVMAGELSEGEVAAEHAFGLMGSPGDTPVTKPLSDEAEPVFDTVPRDEESAPSPEPADTPDRDLPAV